MDDIKFVPQKEKAVESLLLDAWWAAVVRAKYTTHWSLRLVSVAEHSSLPAINL
jgi:hypothetical protein